MTRAMNHMFAGFLVVSCAAGGYADTWSVVQTPTTSQLNGVVVVQDSIGYAVGVRGTIVRTSNGGSSWTKEVAGLDARTDLTSVAGIISGCVVAVGQNGTTIGRIIPSVSWGRWDINGNALNEICNTTTSTFIIVGSGGFVARDSTTLGWPYSYAQISKQGTFSGRSLNAVVFVTPSDGIAVGDSGLMLVTHASGAFWTETPPPTRISFRSIAAAGANLACAVGDAGNIWLSTDQGSNWQNVSPAGLSTNLYSVSYSDAQTVVAVGDTGMILKSTNGGRTWVQQAVNTFANLRGVSCWQFESKTNWVAVGDSGTIVRTIYGGSTVDFTKNKTAIDFGAVQVASRRADTIRFTNTSAASYLTVEASSTDPHVSVFPEHIRVEPMATGTFYVVYSPNDTIYTTASVVFRNDARWIPDTVKISGHGVAAIGVASTDTIQLGKGFVGNTRTMYLRSVGNEALTASAAYVSDTNFTLQCGPPAQAGDSIAIVVAIKHEITRDVTRLFVLSTNDYRNHFDTVYVVVHGVVGVKDEHGTVVDNRLFGCYPNPFNATRDAELSIVLPSQGAIPATITISDALGRVRSGRNFPSLDFTSRELRLNVRGLPVGTYMCNLTCGVLRKQFPFVIMK